MGEVPPLTKLYGKYQAEHFQFFIVYAREAHPGENFPHHDSAEQKLAHAQKLRDLEQIREIPILVDDFSGATHRAYGSLPNMIYLIDRDGVVVYKSDWSDAHEIDGMCASLVRRDEMKANQVPLIAREFPSACTGFPWIRSSANGFTGAPEKKRFRIIFMRAVVCLRRRTRRKIDRANSAVNKSAPIDMS